MVSSLKMLGQPQILNLQVGTDKVPKLVLYLNILELCIQIELEINIDCATS